MFDLDLKMFFRGKKKVKKEARRRRIIPHSDGQCFVSKRGHHCVQAGLFLMALLSVFSNQARLSDHYLSLFVIF